MALIDSRGPTVNSPVVLTYATSVTPDASLANAFKVTATGNLTINPPSNPVDGFMLLLSVLASGGARTVTVSASVQPTQGVPTVLVPASGKCCYIGLRYSLLSGSWVQLAGQIET